MFSGLHYLDLYQIILKIKGKISFMYRNLFNMTGQGILIDHVYMWPSPF